MIWFKSCPRCGGDLAEYKDWYGLYISCIQCGYYLSDAEESSLKRSEALPEALPVR